MGEPEAGGLLYRRVAVDNDVGTVQELGPKTYLLFLERGLPSGQYGRGNGRIELVADSRQRPPGSTGPMQPTMAKSADGPAEGGRRSLPGSQSSPRYTKLWIAPSSTPLSILTMTALGTRAPARDRRAPSSIQSVESRDRVRRELEIEHVEVGRDSCRVHRLRASHLRR